MLRNIGERETGSLHYPRCSFNLSLDTARDGELAWERRRPARDDARLAARNDACGPRFVTANKSLPLLPAERGAWGCAGRNLRHAGLNAARPPVGNGHRRAALCGAAGSASKPDCRRVDRSASAGIASCLCTAPGGNHRPGHGMPCWRLLIRRHGGRRDVPAPARPSLLADIEHPISGRVAVLLPRSHALRVAGDPAAATGATDEPHDTAHHPARFAPPARPGG